MPDLKQEVLEQYLQSLLGAPTKVLALTVLGAADSSHEIKSYGYGCPVKVDFAIDGRPRTAVLHTMSPGPFGHEHMADRAQELIWDHRAFNHLPRHVHSLDVCGFQRGGHLISVGNVEEFGLLTEYALGESYSHDLERLRSGANELTPLDLTRADALCDYLVEIHQSPGPDPGLYLRRIRELVGHGECIMGIADSFPPHPLIPASLLEKIEHLCVNWRWRLKGFTHRLRQVHGDFHPWNILFHSPSGFSLLDRSRGEFGDPTDDVTSLTMNFLFFSLQRSGRLEGGLETLFLRFWDRYLEKSKDREMLTVAAPFLAFRGLVMASPVWYPALPDSVRQKLLAFIVAVLESDSFDPTKANSYCEG